MFVSIGDAVSPTRGKVSVGLTRSITVVARSFITSSADADGTNVNLVHLTSVLSTDLSRG